MGSLCDHGVAFILIGGFACEVYDVGNSTADIDIIIEPSQSNIAALVAALESIDCSSRGGSGEQSGHPTIRGANRSGYRRPAFRHRLRPARRLQVVRRPHVRFAPRRRGLRGPLPSARNPTRRPTDDRRHEGEGGPGKGQGRAPSDSPSHRADGRGWKRVTGRLPPCTPSVPPTRSASSPPAPHPWMTPSPERRLRHGGLVQAMPVL